MPERHFKDHFSTVSASYAAHRPTYPLELVEALARLCPRHERALDCGCGTGQLSTLLAERFDEVMATDASSAQIAQAKPHQQVTYRTALAENSGLPPASVDLVTVAQAAHWLDLDKFYAEVRRVARPLGVVALISYGVLRVEGEAVDRPIQRFYRETLEPYWPPERRHVEAGYRSLAFPFVELPVPSLAIEVSWTLDDLVGYLSTWSAVKAAETSLGVLLTRPLRDELLADWGDTTLRRRITFPLSVRAGRVQH